MNDLSARLAKLSPAQREALAGRREKPAAREIPRRTETGPVPLSSAQQRLWFLDQLQPDSPAYNVPLAVWMEGNLRTEALERGLTEIVRRHESLRTTFSTDGQGRPVQIIHAPRSLVLARVDLAARPPEQRVADAERLALEEAVRPFNLERGPLLRATLLQLEPQRHLLVLTLHHIVSDGWSLGVFYRELSLLYEAFAEHHPSPLPELAIQYADFAVWHRRWLEGGALSKPLAYWKEQLRDLPTLQLRTDRPRPPRPRFHSAVYGIELPPLLANALRSLAREESATLFMGLLAAFLALLHRDSGQDDIVVGTMIAGRNRLELEDLIGFFVNTLVLRVNASGDPTFREWLRRVRAVALAAYAHQDVPFEKLVEELRPQRDLSRNPLFQVAFTLVNVPAPTLELAGVRLSRDRTDRTRSRFDLDVHLREEANGLSGFVRYSTDLFEAATIARMMGRFRRLIEGAVAEPNRRLTELPLLTDAERQ